MSDGRLFSSEGLDLPMDSVTQRPSVNEALQADIVKAITRWAPKPGVSETPISGLTLFRRENSQASYTGCFEPCISLVLQGRRRMVSGGTQYEHGASQYFLTSVQQPVIARVIGSSAAEPYLGLMMTFNRSLLRQLIVELNPFLSDMKAADGPSGLGTLSVELLEPLSRLFRLMDQPRDISILSDCLQREILYRLMTSEQQMRIQRAALVRVPSEGILAVVESLKENYTCQIEIGRLAKIGSMSVSGLHHNFKAFMTISPIQYQKQLRLNEARRLLSDTRLHAGTIGMRVGYESQSQFTREYRRLFGKPPRKDMQTARFG